jgi:hypothetical protein
VPVTIHPTATSPKPRVLQARIYWRMDAGPPPRDRAGLEIWRLPLQKAPSRRARLAAVARDSRRKLIEQIRRWQALPADRRTNFLRRACPVPRERAVVTGAGFSA